MAASQEGLGGLVGSKNLRVGVASGIIGGGAAVSPTTASELQQSGRSGSPPGMLGAGGAGVGSPAGGVGMGATTGAGAGAEAGRRPGGRRAAAAARAAAPAALGARKTPANMPPRVFAVASASWGGAKLTKFVVKDKIGGGSANAG